MQPIISTIESGHAGSQQPQSAPKLPEREADDKPLREAFDSFVGETFLYADAVQHAENAGQAGVFLRRPGGRNFPGPARPGTGRANDQANADTFTGPMFELFSLNRA